MLTCPDLRPPTRSPAPAAPQVRRGAGPLPCRRRLPAVAVVRRGPARQGGRQRRGRPARRRRVPAAPQGPGPRVAPRHPRQPLRRGSSVPAGLWRPGSSRGARARRRPGSWHEGTSRGWHLIQLMLTLTQHRGGKSEASDCTVVRGRLSGPPTRTQQRRRRTVSGRRAST